jgi:erythromycin esterase-like protein
VIRILNEVNPETANIARQNYACFEPSRGEPEAYGLQPSLCQQQAESVFGLIQQMAPDATLSADELFNLQQNARIVKNAARYYTSMYSTNSSSWNLRDQHMIETVQAIDTYFGAQSPTKIIVWAHNSHVGDASATERSQYEEVNVGQLAREHYGDNAFLIGFSTYTGTVMAAPDWGEEGTLYNVVPGLEGSYEDLFHEIGVNNFLLFPPELSEQEVVSEARLQRAIGVIYRPETERWSHYYTVNLPEAFDALIHIDETKAVQPLYDLASANAFKRR